MIKSVNQWSFPAEYSAKDCLLAAKKAGYAGFEPAFNAEGEMSPETYEKDAKELKALAEKEGMILTSLASGVYWSYPLTATDPAVREKAKQLIRAQIDCAKALGVDSILVVPGTVGRGFWGGDDNVSYADAYLRALKGVKEVAPYAEEKGVTIALENVWNNFLLSPLEFAGFIDEVGSERVGAYFDIGNVIRTGEAEHWIRILGKRISRMHIKDFKRSVGTLDGFCDLLCGDVNFPEVVKAMKEIGYDGAVTAEMNIVSQNAIAVVERTKLAMDIIFA